MKTDQMLMNVIDVDRIVCGTAGVSPHYLMIDTAWNIDLEDKRVRWETQAGIAGAFMVGDFEETETYAYVSGIFEETVGVLTLVFKKDNYFTTDAEDLDESTDD